jgi:putative ABC transport system permease protein
MTTSLTTGLLPLLISREWRHHPWRHAVALMAVALGVALAYSVHLINSSALAEFSGAVRSVNGEPDLSLRGPREGFDDELFERVATDPAVVIASPVVEVDTYAKAASATDRTQRVALKVIGIDALQAAPLAPALLPQPAATEARTVFLDPEVAFLNPAARSQLGLKDGDNLLLQTGTRFVPLRVAGSSAVSGTATVVMDIAGAQRLFGSAGPAGAAGPVGTARAPGRLSRIDLRLQPGSDRDALLKRLALPTDVQAAAPDEAEQRLSKLSRAYRVNLTVLALVALFVGAFLVFSVVSLSVAQRTPSFALLGVLGMTAAQRQRWVLMECAVVGAVGSAIGLLMGAGLAAAALRLLAGDLGGGYFPGIAPRLQIGLGSALAFGVLGLLSAVVGGWWPARQAQAIAPALALKGLGSPEGTAPPAWPGLLLLASGAAAAFMPPIAGLPLAAYVAVAALLFGGVALVPAVVHLLLQLAPSVQGALPLLAIQRARFQRRTASAAVAGVVASLALSVALTVMVASFRSGVSEWLNSVLPADLYARTASSTSAAEQAWLLPDFVNQAAAVPGVQRVQAGRTRALQLGADRPSVALVSRDLGTNAARVNELLPLLKTALPTSSLQPGEVAVYVSEAVVALYGAKAGTVMELPLFGEKGGASVSGPGGGQGAVQGQVQGRVLGVWRDYARQFGAIVMADTDYQRLTGDTRINDLALWLAPSANETEVQQALRALLPDASMLDFASSRELRVLSLRIFDRSFAVTYYLQAVAITIGLVGIAASLSAQVLARRKEFGLLTHLGLTRRQIVAVVAGEGLAWVAAGACVGLVLGLAISLVLVFVVNPQSFHWTMDIVLPWGRLVLLALAVVLAGTATAAFSARRAAGRAAVLSVKEDW